MQARAVLLPILTPRASRLTPRSLPFHACTLASRLLHQLSHCLPDRLTLRIRQTGVFPPYQHVHFFVRLLLFVAAYPLPIRTLLPSLGQNLLRDDKL